MPPDSGGRGQDRHDRVAHVEPGILSAFRKALPGDKEGLAHVSARVPALVNRSSPMHDGVEVGLEPRMDQLGAVTQKTACGTRRVVISCNRTVGNTSGSCQKRIVHAVNRHSMEHGGNSARLNQPRADRSPSVVKRANLPHPLTETSDALRDDLVRCSLPSSIGDT